MDESQNVPTKKKNQQLNVPCVKCKGRRWNCWKFEFVSFSPSTRRTTDELGVSQGLFFFIPLFFTVFFPPLRFSSTLVPPGVTGIKLSFVRQTHKLAVGARILPAVREQASEVVRLIFVHIQKCLAPQGRQRRLQKQGRAGKGALKKRLSSFGLVGREPAGISQASSL